MATTSNINDGFIYLDYVGLFSPGQTVELTSEHVGKVVNTFTTTFRQLTRYGMKSQLGAAYEGVTGSLSVKYDSETEIEKVTETQVKNEARDVSKVNFVLGDQQYFGTVLYKVDIQFGGIKQTGIPIDMFTSRWDPKRLEQFNSFPMTASMATLLRSAGIQVSRNNEYRIALYPPITGRTCHHVKFLRLHSDGCNLDGKSCLELSNQFVVCHHNDYLWMGGKGCDCATVDNVNVTVARAEQLSPLYRSHTA